MKIEKDLYPKTKRIANICEITEKIDGGNIQFFKINGILYMATRNNVMSVADEKEFIQSTIEPTYTGVLEFLEKYEKWLTENIYEGSSIIGEWTRNERYIDLIEKSRFVMFAKGRVEYRQEKQDFKMSNIVYNHDLLKYVFNDGKIPDFINLVPLVETSSKYLTIEKLDELYDEYCKKVNRLVEGFVINYNGEITKYVRLKKGKMKPHHS